MRKRRKIRRNNKKTKKVAIISSLVILLLISVGYGAFQTNLSLNIIGKIKEYEIGHVWTFGYTGNSQEFKVPQNGTYKIELWGASGGKTYYDSDENLISNGGYTKGKISLPKNNKLYFYVGGNGVKEDSTAIGGYNGGGNSSKNTNNMSGPSGGGATDIRIINGNWNDFASLKSRIMVAAGGGGSMISYITLKNHSHGGGLNGYDAYNSLYQSYMGKGGNQINGGEQPIKHDCAQTNGETGKFGIGGTGGISKNSASHGGGAGGGAGYYGGSGGSGLCNGVFGAGGGSSFISGHNGCDAISEQSTEDNIIHTGQSIHYSGLYFTETEMIDGAGYKWTDHKLEDLGSIGMPTHSGIGTMTGNNDNGYAKITLVSKE